MYEKQSGSIRQFTYSAKSDFCRAGRPTANGWLSFQTATNNSRSYSMRADGGEASA